MNVKIRRERPVRRPRPLERDRKGDVPSPLRDIDVAFPALVLDAAPRPHVIAAIRHGLADRHAAKALRDDEPVPRAEHTAIQPHRALPLPLAVDVERAEMQRLAVRIEQ